MSKKIMYKITILNWEKHNTKVKQSYPYFMISKRIFNDQKIAQLSPIEFQMYVYFLSIAADMVSNSFAIGVQMVPKYMRISARMMSNCCERFEQLQLVTAEKTDSFINRIEKKGKEKKRKESPKGTKQKILESDQEIFQDANASPPVESNIGKKLVGIYCENWKARYKSNPPIRAQDAKNLKQLGETHGFDSTKKLIEAYLRMNEKWFLQKRHDLASLMNNLTSVAHFIETGRVMTGQDLRTVDRAIANKNTLDALEKGEI